MGCPWIAYEPPVIQVLFIFHGFTVLAHGLSMGLWYWPMGLPWVFHGSSMGLP